MAPNPGPKLLQGRAEQSRACEQEQTLNAPRAAVAASAPGLAAVPTASGSHRRGQQGLHPCLQPSAARSSSNGHRQQLVR